MKDWTPEQERNAKLFGVCFECGTPRKAEVVMYDGVVEYRFDPTTCEHVERLDDIARDLFGRPIPNWHPGVCTGMKRDDDHP